MNWRRGFFRLWLVFTLFWLIAVGGVVAVMDEPALLPEAFVMKDTTSGFFKLDNVSDAFSPPFQATHHVVHFPNNVTLYVTTSVPEEVMKAKGPEFYKTYSEPRGAELSAARFTFWRNTVMWALIPPVAVLIVGVLLAWIVAGFSREAGPS